MSDARASESASCDVLIVGGGPAGSTCARELIRAGIDALILDKQQFPRDKTCAGWITPSVVDELRLDLDDYARGGRVIQPFTGFRTSVLGATEVETRYPRVVSYGIRRCEFDEYLLRRSGARLALGEKLESLERDGDGWTVNGRLRARLIVGAGGHFCPVARQVGAQLGSGEAVIAAQEVEFEMTPRQQAACTLRPDTPELFFLPDLSGYAWAVRKQHVLNVGLGRQDNKNLAQHVERFIEFLQRRGKLGDVPSRFKGHAYLLYGENRRALLDDGVLLIGDAAGLAYPQSGEGIRPAIESGLLAAQTLIEARGDYSRARLARYAQRIEQRFGPRSTGRRIHLAALLPVPLKQALAKQALGNRWFARHVLMDRWFLHQQQMPLRGVVHGALTPLVPPFEKGGQGGI
jgi:geranylgeranyl reductase family protein